MDYKDLNVYQGRETACENCGRSFTSGEIITVGTNTQGEGHVFCYSDSDGGCMIGYTFSTGLPMVGNPFRYGTETLPEDTRTPNHPHTPVFARHKEEQSPTPHKSWLSKFWDWLTDPDL